MFGQLNRLVENDAVRRLRAAQQLIRPDEKNRTLNERYALQVAVDKRRKLSFKRSVLADRSRKQCREQLTVAARPVFRRKTEIFNGRAFLIIGKERRKILSGGGKCVFVNTQTFLRSQRTTRNCWFLSTAPAGIFRP